MFAKRGSSLSLKKLPCLGNALLTLCCLLVIITDVSSMSLNRLARQYQQQNDKLLDINKILLPEAESEMLQNNVEIVPALDGNSDMYLLVPATALNQEQNLQSLTAQLSDAQHADDNIEINSDMLMLGSDDTPIVQILKVPEEVLESNKITQENDLMNEQNSADMLNSIAEAAQEIENEIETELMGSDENSKQEELVEKQATKQQEGSYSINESEDNEMEKVLENENSEQEMIGVVMEEANDNSAGTGSVKKVLTAQELRQQNAAATKTEIEKTETEENVSGSELMQQSVEQVNGNMETEMEASRHENNLEEMSVEQDSKSEKLQDIPNEMPTEAVKEIKMESQAVEQNKDKENMPADDNETPDTDESQNEEVEDIKAEAADDLSVKKHQAEEINSEEIPNVMAAEKHESEVINNERPTSSIETQAVEDLQIVNDIPEFLHALETESLTNAEADNTDANENINESSKEEAQEIDQFESTTSALISENDDFNTVNEKEALASEMNEEQMQNEKENQAVAEIHELTDQKYDDEVNQAEDLMTNIAAEEAATVEKDVQVSDETPYMEETERVKETTSSEEAKPDKEIQFSEAADDTTEPQTAEEMQFYEVIPQKPEDALTGEQSAEEVQHQEEMQDAEVVEEAQSTEQTESLEDMQSDFISNFKPVEDISTEIDNQNSTEEETFLEDNKQNAEDDNATAETLEASQEVDASSDDSYVVPDSVTETLFSAIEENKIDEHVTQQPEAQELANEQQEEPEPLNTISEHNVAQAILTNMAAVVADKENAKLPEESGVTQNPSEHNDSDNESETVKQTTPTVMQIPTKEEQLTQQEHIENAQQQQPLAVHTIGSTTLKPLNVFNNVLNYVNASFMNQMNTDNNNNNENYIKQEIKEKETQVFNTKLRRYDGAQVWRIVVQNDKERKLADELQTKFDGQLWKEVKQEVDYLLKPQVLADAEQHVRAANLSRIVLIDNLQKVIEVENPPAEKIAQLQNRKGYRLTWEAYHRLEDIHGFFDYLAKTYPDICTVETIGYSLQKRPLKILKISNGNASNPGIWIDGGMHAREWISPSVVTYIANQIAEGWDDLPLYMRNINWYLHAVANPDGYEYSHTTDRLWRKNLRSHGRACPGVDLNRNFGYKWGGKGTSANPCSQTYRGSKAFSEPETFYISKFISNFPRETFKAYLSFHSYGQYILYPWGYDYHITNDMSDLDLLARQAGTIITKSTGAKFTVGSSATTLYPAAGGSDDWAKGIAGIKYSYTIEMGDTGRYGFVLPAEYIEPNGKNGLTFVQTIAKAITMGKNARRSKLKFRLNH